MKVQGNGISIFNQAGKKTTEESKHAYLPNHLKKIFIAFRFHAGRYWIVVVLSEIQFLCFDELFQRRNYLVLIFPKLQSIYVMKDFLS